MAGSFDPLGLGRDYKKTAGQALRKIKAGQQSNPMAGPSLTDYAKLSPASASGATPPKSPKAPPK